MATSSIEGGERAPVQPKGTDTGALGPSDSSDSGSDVQGERGFDALDEGEIGGERADLTSDTDSTGTGEHGAAVHDSDIVEGADIAPDHVERAGGGTDVEDDDELRSDLEALSDDADAEEPEADDADSLVDGAPEVRPGTARRS